MATIATMAMLKPAKIVARSAPPPSTSGSGVSLRSLPAAAKKKGGLAAAAPADDNRGLLLLIVVTPAIGWVLFNILQPALNQLNRMRSD